MVPGFANRVVAKFVSGAVVHFEETAKYSATPKLQACRCGRRFSKSRPSAEARRPCWSSAGARAHTRSMRKWIRCLPVLQREAPGIHVIHQTGERDYNDALAAYGSRSESAARVDVQSLEVYRRHARGICPRRSGRVSLGREHSRLRKSQRQRSSFRSRARPTIINASTRKPWRARVRQW